MTIFSGLHFFFRLTLAAIISPHALCYQPDQRSATVSTTHRHYLLVHSLAILISLSLSRLQLPTTTLFAVSQLLPTKLTACGLCLLQPFVYVCRLTVSTITNSIPQTTFLLFLYFTTVNGWIRVGVMMIVYLLMIKKLGMNGPCG